MSEDVESTPSLDDFVAIPDEPLTNEQLNSTEQEADERPPIYSPKWQEFVLSHFLPDEVFEGNPTADGLRRVAEELLGPIVESYPTSLQQPNPQNQYTATVMWTVVFEWAYPEEGMPIGQLRKFGDIADVNIDNTDPEFARHASATAATRGEARALRKALRLKHIHAVEELTSVPVEDRTDGKIKKSQITCIDMMCGPENLDIDVRKVLNSCMKKCGAKTVNDIPWATAIKVIEYLNKYQSGMEPIPGEIKGYQQNWKEGFYES